MLEAPAGYPAKLEVDYPEQLDRLSTAFRIILFVPVAVFLGLLSGGGFGSFRSTDEVRQISFGGGGVVVAIMAAVFVRQYIPRWIFDFQVALMSFQVRAYGYIALLSDRFPAFENDPAFRFSVRYPEALNRWKVLVWKVITAIPHFIILIFLTIIAIVAVIIAWFAILFTGRYPRGLFDFVMGVMRWGLRVEVYVWSMTDEYPPFSMEPA